MLPGSLLHPGERNGEFIWFALVSLALSMAVFVFPLALGMPAHFGMGHINPLNEIRGGRWTYFSYDRAESIINFPSFHTTLAVLFTGLA